MLDICQAGDAAADPCSAKRSGRPAAAEKHRPTTAHLTDCRGGLYWPEASVE